MCDRIHPVRRHGETSDPSIWVLILPVSVVFYHTIDPQATIGLIISGVAKYVGDPGQGNLVPPNF